MRTVTRLLIVVAIVIPLLLGARKHARAHSQPKQQATPAATKPVSQSGATLSPAVPSPEKFQFAEALEVLKRPDNVEPVPQAPSAKASGTGVLTKDVSGIVRTDKDIPLNQTAKDALAMSSKWQNAHNAPVEGSDGRVLYTYGAGLPTLVCAPLHMCIIELQSGERFAGEPHIGDAVRWTITPTASGTGDHATPMIVVKPRAAGLDTNLFIPTDRRAYYIRLISRTDEYVARLAFEYPDDELPSKWPDTPPPSSEPDAIVPISSFMESLYTNYQIHGGDDSIRPVRVMDDGVKTYIEMSDKVLHREAPALVVIGPDGKPEMVNYRLNGRTYIVDRLFERAALILGSGRKARKVEIVRQDAHKH